MTAAIRAAPAQCSDAGLQPLTQQQPVGRRRLREEPAGNKEEGAALRPVPDGGQARKVRARPARVRAAAAARQAQEAQSPRAAASQRCTAAAASSAAPLPSALQRSAAARPGAPRRRATPWHVPDDAARAHRSAARCRTVTRSDADTPPRLVARCSISCLAATRPAGTSSSWAATRLRTRT